MAVRAVLFDLGNTLVRYYTPAEFPRVLRLCLRECAEALGRPLDDARLDDGLFERALSRLPQGNPALTELPFLIAEVGEPGCAKLLGRFLQNDDAEVVASAIEAMAELGDPAAIPLLAKLERDGRQVQLDEEEGGERVPIADLAHEAKEILEELVQETSAPPRGTPPARTSPEQAPPRDRGSKKGRR